MKPYFNAASTGVLMLMLLRDRQLSVICGVIWLALAAFSAPAQPSSASLIRGGADDKGTYLTGILIHLEPGWMTYWRKPGDVGIAPVIDLMASENIKGAEILFPAPKLFQEGEFETLGYEGDVVIPLRIVPQDASKPVRLRVFMKYGVCEKICVP